jgi:hypothetical protein
MAVRRRKDTGKWVADIRDAFGRRRQVSFDAKEAALDFEAEQRRARQRQRYVAFDPETTLTTYAETWLATRPVRATTRQRYEAALKLHILPALGALRVTEVTRERVRRFLAEKLEDAAANLQGHRRQRTERRRARALHRNTVRHMLKLLAGVLNAAVSDQLLPANPLQGLGR